jgi:hypothetical protein
LWHEWERTAIYTGIWLESLIKSTLLGRLKVDLGVILKWNLMKQNHRVQTGLIWHRERKGAGSCELGNGISRSIKCCEYYEQLRQYQLLKKALLYGVN